MPRRRRGQDDETNWSLRDNVSWYTDQAKAAPGAAKALLSIPLGLGRGIREMAADMRDVPPSIRPDDPVLAPIDGVTFATLVRATAAMMSAGVAEGDAAGRDAIAQAHGVPRGKWAAADAAWEQRRAQDARLTQAFAWSVRTELAQRGG